MRRLVAEFPDDHPGVNTITLDPMWRSPFGANVYLAASLPILLAIAGVVLLLTCANVATLALVRFVSRRREIAIRQSLGAGRIQLMRQMIVEGMLVSLAGGALALLLTSWTANRLTDFIPANSIPIVLNGTVDRNVVSRHPAAGCCWPAEFAARFPHGARRMPTPRKCSRMRQRASPAAGTTGTCSAASS